MRKDLTMKKNDRKMFKMTEEELRVWLSLRGKGHAMTSKKDYKRKKNWKEVDD